MSPLLVGDDAVSVQRSGKLLPPLRGRRSGAGPAVPLDRQDVRRGLCLPVVLRHDGDTALDLHRADDAGPLGDRREVVRTHRPADHGAVLHGSVDHARQPHVHAEDRRTVNLRRGIEPPARGAYDGEPVRCLDRHLAHFDGGRLGRKFTEAQRPVAVRNAGVRRLARLGRDPPPLGGGAHQAFPRVGAGGLQVGPAVAHGLTAAGPHALVHAALAQAPVGVGVLRAHVLPGRAQFVRDDHRQAREHALSHLRLGDADRHGVVRGDDEPRVDLSGAVDGFERPRVAERRQVKSDHEAAGRGRGRLQETSSVHATPPSFAALRSAVRPSSAARWMPLRTRW